MNLAEAKSLVRHCTQLRQCRLCQESETSTRSVELSIAKPQDWGIKVKVKL